MTTLIKKAITGEVMTEKETAYDEFNTEIPENEFPKSGMSARAAEAIVVSEAWTDANPAQNMSSPADKVSPIIA